MNANDAIENMDIGALAQMFEADDYARLRQWVVARKDLTERPERIATAMEHFHSLRDDAIRSCVAWTNAATRYSFSPEDARHSATTRLRSIVNTLCEDGFIGERERDNLLQSIRKTRIRKTQTSIANLKWNSTHSEVAATNALEQRLQDPRELLSELLQILTLNFGQLKAEADNTILKLVQPLQNLDRRITSDLHVLNSEITAYRANDDSRSTDNDSRMRRLQDRIDELQRIQGILSRRAEEVKRTATIFRDIAINVKAFIDIVRDQLNWIEKRSEYVSALTALGESVEQMQESSSQTLTPISEELSSIKTAIGAKSAELHDSMRHAIEEQTTLNSILHGKGEQLRVEVELSKGDISHPPRGPIDFDELSGLLDQLREL